MSKELLSETIDSLNDMIEYADDGIISRYDINFKTFFEKIDKAKEVLKKLNELYIKENGK